MLPDEPAMIVVFVLLALLVMLSVYCYDISNKDR